MRMRSLMTALGKQDFSNRCKQPRHGKIMFMELQTDGKEARSFTTVLGTE
jgi:hypothetical protein